MTKRRKEYPYVPAWYNHNARVRELVHVIAIDTKGSAWVRWASDQRMNEVDSSRVELIVENNHVVL